MIILEREKGIEPSQPAWKASVLPLNYSRKKMVGREGFAPSKAHANGFTARPIWLLWYLPNNEVWSREVGSNHRPEVYKTPALPLSYPGMNVKVSADFYGIRNIIQDILRAQAYFTFFFRGNISG